MTAAAAADCPADRFSTWPRARARLLIAALVALLVLSAWVPITADDPATAQMTAAPRPTITTSTAAPERDEDLALYDRIAARVAQGESYYPAAVDEQRRGDYPVRPGLAVRLPTLAWATAAQGPTGMHLLALALVMCLLAAWWQRFGEEPDGAQHRLMATALLVPGCALALSGEYLVMHEVWAGLLVLLSFGLHRSHRWGASLAVAALALMVREHVLPFVLLMAATAFWRRDLRQGAAWSLLALAFVGVMTIHLAHVAPFVRPTDPASPSWLALRGLSGWLSNVALSGSLQFMPHWLAGPLIVLMMLGWAGWKSPAGAFATLLFCGYALLYMIAGRANNFYWGAVIAPGLYAGLAFAPQALGGLWRAAK